MRVSISFHWPSTLPFSTWSSLFATESAYLEIRILKFWATQYPFSNVFINADFT